MAQSYFMYRYIQIYSVYIVIYTILIFLGPDIREAAAVWLNLYRIQKQYSKNFLQE